MTNFKVKVKWGKEIFADVEMDMSEPPMVFKAQLFALTGVEPERQKVMVKGATLKDDDWGTIKLRDGITILLMGTKEELPAEPVIKPVFMEDMSESELATALEMPPGLHNLGNTCYMNATVQCLRSVPELRDALKKFPGTISSLLDTMVPSQSITAALRDLFVAMDKTSSSIPPIVLLQMLQICFPRFSEKSEQGGNMQQDANECWTEVMRMLQQKLPAVPSADLSEACMGSKYSSFIDQFFGGEFDVTLKCAESEDEPETHSKENFLQLSCFISQEVKYLHSGLKSRMQETITKLSPSLNRDAQYLKTCKISRLPAYLTVQFVRFFYKEKGSINAKILKDVKFPLSLDLFELCGEELQQRLSPMRSKFKELEDKKLEDSQKIKEGKPNEKTLDSKKDSPVKHEPFSFPEDPGSNNSGYYELRAVLTHRGRSSSSGHYVAWVQRKNDEWLKCDDETMSVVTAEEILRLSGGGDWHCAYVLLYAPRVLEINDEETDKMDTVTS